MRRTIVLLVSGLLLLVACPVTNNNTDCTTGWICASDGRQYCGYLPPGLGKLPAECCPEQPVVAAAVDGSVPVPPDAQAPLPAAGDGAVPAGLDASQAPQCKTGDGGLDWFWMLKDAGRLPDGRDDAGIPFLYQCGIDQCHNLVDGGVDGGYPYPWLLADASNNCGPLGCH